MMIIAAAGPAFRLRPVAIADARFIVELRSEPSLGKYIHQGATTVAEQEKWIAEHVRAPNDYYYIVERRATDRAEGTVSIYNVARNTEGLLTAEWGRWVLRPDSMAAVESALLIYRVAFDKLNLDVLYCHTVADNRHVVSFHASCGLSMATTAPPATVIRGTSMDLVEQFMTRRSWEKWGPEIERWANTVARMLDRQA